MRWLRSQIARQRCSRSQLLKGDARRCSPRRRRVRYLAEDTAALLQPRPTSARSSSGCARNYGAARAAAIALEQKRLSKMKRLRRLLVRLCAAGGRRRC